MSADLKIVKKKLNTLLGDESLVDKYLEKFGSKIDIKFIKQIKNDAAASSPRKIKETHKT